jgi:hypothetical protein
VYFLLSVGLSLLVTYRYGFFEEGTFSHALLRLLLRSLGGVLMLLRCSPNPDICVALGMAALMRDHILDWSHYLWITLEAAKQTPSSQLSGQRPLTADDFAHQGQVHTTAALRELREYLLTPEGKAQAAKVNWRSVLLLVLDLASPHLTLCPLWICHRWREANRDDLSSKLEHFTKGMYSGRPGGLTSSDDDSEALDEGGEVSDDSSPPQSPPRSWARSVFTLLFYSLLCLAISGMVALVVFDPGSESTTASAAAAASHNGLESVLSTSRSFLEALGVLRKSSGDSEHGDGEL